MAEHDGFDFDAILNLAKIPSEAERLVEAERIVGNMEIDLKELFILTRDIFRHLQDQDARMSKMVYVKAFEKEGN